MKRPLKGAGGVADRRAGLAIAREYAPDEDAVRRAFAILLNQSGERKDKAA